MSLYHVILAGVLSISLSGCATAQDKVDIEPASNSVNSKRQKTLDALDAKSLSAIQVVENYLDAYSRLDVRGMGEFFPDDVEFIDQTSESTPLAPTPYIYDNKKDLLATMGRIGQFSEGVEFDIDRIWESSGYVVVVADVVWTDKASKGLVEAPSQIVSVFKVEGNKITELRDYFDYNQWARRYPQ
ncbi:MAG: nuclear transport factor 2 family protein [Litorimonas sp.]